MKLFSDFESCIFRAWLSHALFNLRKLRVGHRMLPYSLYCFKNTRTALQPSLYFFVHKYFSAEHTNKKRKDVIMRRSGILLPIFSLPSPYGIGCFSNEAIKFIDFLVRTGQTYWQVLPLGPTSYGDSPYQSPSVFAGNPYFIDIDTLKADGLLTAEECDVYRAVVPVGDEVDYKFLYDTRDGILRKAFARFTATDDYRRFTEEESFWLEDFASFAAIKEYFGGVGLTEWDEPVRMREDDAVASLLDELAEDIEYHKFVQYQFMCQWIKIREYANSKGIRIIGDMPIYTALDSAESWVSPELFCFDEKRLPTHVAGCPPDPFAKDGQLWGNPVYDWDYHHKTGYKWWVERLRRSMRLYDAVRIDHFRGFDSFYAIPYGSKTARTGKWYAGPGMKLFDVLNRECPDLHIIAEDLGFITDSVKALLESTGYPGMKVLQFAFDSREDSDYLPHNYIRNSVVYTGTHDNSTCAGWAQTADDADITRAAEYMGVSGKSIKDICDGFVRLAMGSVADTCIIPIQDYIGLDDDARINTPGTLGGNWRWRMGRTDDDTEKKIAHITAIYGRNNKIRKADENV